MAVLRPKRGEVWWVNFNPSTGSESRKVRPAIVVSNNHFNRIGNRFQVVPLTSNISRVYPSDCIVTVRGQKGKATANQLTTVDISRMEKKIVKLKDNELEQVEQVIKIQLGLGL
ncbi:MAG: type II toxin-antitoxin system PemK/MazF family toxin [Candidatus Paceibacteria bacterium]